MLRISGASGACPYIDQINHAPIKDVSDLAFRQVNVGQGAAPGTQVAAAAAVFLLVCARFKARPEDALRVANNMMVSRDGQKRPQFAAIEMYLREDCV